MSTVAPDVAFVGRGRELDALAAHLAAQGRPSGGVLLTSGPAGVGKTRLVDEAVRRAAGPAVVRGYCPAETAPPLWPWRAALKRAGVETARETDIEPAAAKSAWFAALAQMSDALIAAGPLAVVLEDLHWADAASLDLLAQVAAVAGGTDLTIIGTARSPAAQDIAVRLADLGRYGAVTLTLAPFTIDEVAELVDPAAASDVHKRTGGLPLLVAAVRAGYASADLAVVVSGLLAALTPAQRVIIEAAAVLGETAERMRLGDLVADRAEALGLPLAALMGHEWRLHAAYLSARFDVVDTAVTAIERLTRASALPLARWHLHRLYASRTLLAGQFAGSAVHSGRACAIAHDSGDAVAMAMHFAHGIRLALVRGEAGCLPDGYREALAAAPLMPLVDVERANVLMLTGSLREARGVYDTLCGLLPFPAEHPAWMAVLIQMVELIQLFDDAATAEIVYRQLLPFRPYPGALGTSTVCFMGTISRYLGELAEVSGDRPTAIELLREALPRNRAIGARPEVALTSLGLARLLRDGNRAEMAEAATLAQDALDLAARLDMPGTVAAAGRLAAQIAADRDQADPLTGREREIAALLGRALSNRQIAARLVLSERTVESHVRSILAKTQCTNRIDFVAKWNPS